MKRLPIRPTVRASSDTFVGEAWYDMIARGEEPSRLRVSIVRFAPGARNAWHRHPMGQMLHVTEGVGIVQAREEDAALLRPGDTIQAPPGEWHWHGAAPDSFMTHLAAREASVDGQDAEWGGQVSDAEYSAAARQAGA